MRESTSTLRTDESLFSGVLPALETNAKWQKLAEQLPEDFYNVAETYCSRASWKIQRWLIVAVNRGLLLVD